MKLNTFFFPHFHLCRQEKNWYQGTKRLQQGQKEEINRMKQKKENGDDRRENRKEKRQSGTKMISKRNKKKKKRHLSFVRVIIAWPYLPKAETNDAFNIQLTGFLLKEKLFLFSNSLLSSFPPPSPSPSTRYFNSPQLFVHLFSPLVYFAN